MKIELSQTEMQDVLGKALKTYLGELMGERIITDVEFKTYPGRHLIITLTKPGDGE